MRRSLPLIALALAATRLAAQPVSAPHVTVELVSERTTIAPGVPFRVGVRFELEKEWHTYWRNPGDAGLAPTVELTLPPGFTASEIEWPYPDLFGDPPEVSYGYHDVVVLPVTITPPATLTEGAKLTLGAKASWLVCADLCIPGKAELSLPLTVAQATSGEPATHAADFAAADARQPRVAKKIAVSALRVGDRYELVVTNAAGRAVPLPADAWFFASEEGVIDHSAKQKLERTDKALVISVPVSAYEEKAPTQMRGVLVTTGSWNGGDLRAITVDVPISIERPAPEPAGTTD